VAEALGQLIRQPTRRAFAAGAASLALVRPAFAQAPSAEAEPIISTYARSLPVLARHGMVASQEEKASRIGVDFLRAGGNAVDAAVATAFALAVTLPRAGNIGGGGFMMIHLARENRDIAIDYREMAGVATDRDVFLDENGAFAPAKSQSSGLGVGVPGTVAGLALAQEKHGSGKFSLAQLIAPAIALARDGFMVDEDLADSLPSATRRLGKYPSSRAIFLRPDGAPLQRGDRLVQSDLAATLATIARDGPRGFYEGIVADRIVAAVTQAGGRMSRDDLAAYRAVERTPVRGTYRGHDIVSMPPPSSGGVHVIEILNILEGFPLADYGHNSARAIHAIAEASKLAYADRSRYLGDPDFVRVPVAGLVSKAYAERLRATISPERARPASEIAPGDPAPYESDQTTHFSVVDDDGNAVANTYTLNFSYGLGMVVDGAGFLLNNELDDFAAREGAANAYGLIGGDANAPGPRKRPLSSMSPTIVLRDGAVELVTGSPGGSRIISIVLEIILNVLDFGMNAAEASEAARVHDQWLPDVLEMERGVSPDTMRLLQALGHKIKVTRAFGSAQTIHRAGGWLMGAADTRQRGTGVAGY
jgi:gamma-glutamyltranspeptidase / glutathione hydrolase